MIKLGEKDLQVIEGKVVIDSEELANAIQNEEIRLTGEEENEGNFICFVNGNTEK